jgi:hypothetical protein
MRPFWQDAVLATLAILSMLGYINIVENFF